MMIIYGFFAGLFTSFVAAVVWILRSSSKPSIEEDFDESYDFEYDHDYRR